MAVNETNQEKLVVGLWDRGVIGFKDEPIPLNSGRLSPYYYNDRNILSINSKLDSSGHMSYSAQLEVRSLYLDMGAAELINIKDRADYEHVLPKPQTETPIGAVMGVLAGQSVIWERVDDGKVSNYLHQQLQGDYQAGQRVLLAENCVTTAGEIQEAIHLAHSKKLRPVAAFAQLDRQEGGSGVIESYGLVFSALVNLSSAIKYLRANGRIGLREVNRLVAYHEAVIASGGSSTFIPYE